MRRDLIRIAWHHRHTLLKGVMSTNARKHAALKSRQADRLSAAGADDTDEAGAERARPAPSSHDEPVRPRRWFARS